MSASEDYDDPLHNELHHAVDHIFASLDLAERVEKVARRRRAARWSGACAIALVAIGGTAGAMISNDEGGRPATVSATANAVRLANCAASDSAYSSSKPIKRASTPGPVVPGKPVAAEVCRYAGMDEEQPVGKLAGSARITQGPQLDQLITDLNASQINPDGGVFCLATNLDAAVFVFAYAGDSPNYNVSFDPACGTLTTNSASFLVRRDITQLIADWTGSWHE